MGLVRKLIWDIRVAIAFLTRLPFPIDHEKAGQTFQTTVWAYPLVGVAVGGAGGALLMMGADGGLHPLAAALLGLALFSLMTGALHEDGLADFADGIGGGWTPEKRLEIMRDSRIGTYGSLALIFSVGLKAAALSSLLGPGIAAALLVAAAAFSRALMPGPMWLLNPARADGLGADAGRPGKTATMASVSIGTGIGLMVLWPMFGWATIWILGAGIIAAIAICWLAVAKLGGYTGDSLGAQQQMTELAILLAAAMADPIIEPFA